MALGNSLRPKRLDGREIRAEMKLLIVQGSEVSACTGAQVLDVRTWSRSRSCRPWSERSDRLEMKALPALPFFGVLGVLGLA